MQARSLGAAAIWNDRTRNATFSGVTLVALLSSALFFSFFPLIFDAFVAAAVVVGHQIRTAPLYGLCGTFLPRVRSPRPPWLSGEGGRSETCDGARRGCAQFLALFSSFFWRITQFRHRGRIGKATGHWMEETPSCVEPPWHHFTAVDANKVLFPPVYCQCR